MQNISWLEAKKRNEKVLIGKKKNDIRKKNLRIGRFFKWKKKPKEIRTEKKNAIFGKSFQNFNYSSLPKVRRDETFFLEKSCKKIKKNKSKEVWIGTLKKCEIFLIA